MKVAAILLNTFEDAVEFARRRNLNVIQFEKDCYGMHGYWIIADMSDEEVRAAKHFNPELPIIAN